MNKCFILIYTTYHLPTDMELDINFKHIDTGTLIW